MSGRDWMAVLWPGFLAACLCELLVFALVDPGDLRWGREGVGLSRQAVYTLGFFLFWAVSTCAGALTLAMSSTPTERRLSKAD